jgi:hypothetical protein
MYSLQPLITRVRVTLLALAAFALVTLIPTFSSAAGSDEIPAYEVVISPNWVSSNDDPASNYNAVWLVGKSATTPYRSPDSYKRQARYLLLDPRAKDADGRQGNDDWWFVIERYWPGDYPASNHGRWGRQVNFHNVAGDAGPNGGVGWGFGSDVSALALDCLPRAYRPQFTLE